MRSRVAAGVVAVVVAVGLAGCSGAAPKPSPTPTPPFASADAAYKAAEATYRGYVDALNKVQLDDPKTLSPLYAWLLGDALENDKRELTSMAAAHIRINGASEVVAMKPVSGGDVRWGDVTLQTCLDVHRVTVTSASGQSLVEDDRPKVQSVIVTFSRDAGTSTGMRIVRMKPEDGGASCAQ